MTADIRLATSFRTHPKRVKLQKRLGADGVMAFVDLLLFVGESKTSGVLTGMTVDDIGIAAQWGGEDQELVDALVAIGLMDRRGDEFVIHDWTDHNAYSSGAEMRKLASRIAAHIRWQKERGITCNKRTCKLCAEHARRMRAAQKRNRPSPSPSPSPSPLQRIEEKKETPPESPKKPAKPSAKDLVESLAVDDDLRAYARRFGQDADDLVDDWRDYFRGTGYRTGRNPVSDAKATFRRWIRNAKGPVPPAVRHATKPREASPISAEYQEIMRRENERAKGKKP